MQAHKKQSYFIINCMNYLHFDLYFKFTLLRYTVKYTLFIKIDQFFLTYIEKRKN